MHFTPSPPPVYGSAFQGQATASSSTPPMNSTSLSSPKKPVKKRVTYDSTSQSQAMASGRISSMHSTSFSSLKNSAKKKVHFKPTCTVRTHTCSGVTKEEKLKLYYSKNDLKVMTLEAQAIILLSQELPDIHNSGTLITMERRDSMLGLDDGSQDNEALDSLRGLELIMYPKRKKNKQLALKSLLKYQSFLNSKKPKVGAERKHLALASASTKLNRWSSLVALETARLDALRAFEGDYLIPITNQPEVDIISPFPFYKKSHEKKRRRGSRRVTPLPQDDGVGISQSFKRRKVG